MLFRDLLDRLIQGAKTPQFWLTAALIAGSFNLPGLEKFFGEGAVDIANLIALAGLVFGFGASWAQARAHAVLRTRYHAALLHMGESKAAAFEDVMDE